MLAHTRVTPINSATDVRRWYLLVKTGILPPPSTADGLDKRMPSPSFAAKSSTERCGDAIRQVLCQIFPCHQIYAVFDRHPHGVNRCGELRRSMTAGMLRNRIPIVLFRPPIAPVFQRRDGSHKWRNSSYRAQPVLEASGSLATVPSPGCRSRHYVCATRRGVGKCSFAQESRPCATSMPVRP
jgi:hypothetical protein